MSDTSNKHSLSGKFHELMFYTLSHPDQDYFIHQHVVDTFPLQTADENIKPITFTYCLIGLYLYLEEGYTGRQVQQAHMRLAKNKVIMQPASLPNQRGNISISDVLAVPAGVDRDRKIRDWCASVWNAYKDYHINIAQYAKEQLGVI